VKEDHPWLNQKVSELPLPPGLILAVIQRNQDVVVPRGDTVIQAGDQIVLGAEGFQNDIGITLKEIVLKEKHPWVGQQIKDLDISRQTLIIMVRRDGKILIPNGSLILQTEDLLLIYTKKVIRDAEIVEL
jgi:voltage-gated potassium channel